jgi:hypothetical protein
MRAKVEIVFRRKVRAIWLEQGLALAAQGAAWSEAKPVLAKEIAAENSGTVTISKVLEHIRRIWFEPPDDALALRTDALRLHQHDASQKTKLLLIWGMAIAAYPFVGSAGEALGRLLKLQKEARRADVQRRLREQYGDRDFVNRIARYTVSSFLDWGIIVETKRKGIYLSDKQAEPTNHEQLAWLAEAALISRGKPQMALSELSNHPVLFPIKLDSLSASLLRANPRLRVERYSLNQESVLLATSNRNGG